MSHAPVARVRKGQPVLMLGILLASWIGLRAMMWGTLPAGREPAPCCPAESVRPAVAQPIAGEPGLLPLALRERRADTVAGFTRKAGPGGDKAGPRRLPSGDARETARRWALTASAYEAAGNVVPSVADTGGRRPVPASSAVRAPSRWHGDGWILLRPGSGGAGAAAGAPSYGASQAGAVLRYSLAPESAHRPAAYLRIAGATGGVRDRQAAAGLMARPLGAIPFAMLAEARVRQGSAGTDIVPAVALVSEVPPQALPMDLEAEAYGQAGWVGGRGATAFFDAQAVVDRRAGGIGRNAEWRLGAGLWAGGQRGGARLDVGPRVSVRMNLGGAFARLSLDARLRVAGQAEPGSGAALTLAAGF